MPATHVALLRGINVGGRNVLPMKRLVAIFESLGAVDVRTYIQSGNVVFGATAAQAKKLPRAAAAAIADEFGFDTPVILRTGREIRAALERNPFLGSCPEQTLHVAFLAAAPTAARGRRLDPERSPGDRCALVGREVYLHLPNGVARTKLTNAWFDATLGTTSTVRNWRTLGRIAAML